MGGWASLPDFHCLSRGGKLRKGKLNGSSGTGLTSLYIIKSPTGSSVTVVTFGILQHRCQQYFVLARMTASMTADVRVPSSLSSPASRPEGQHLGLAEAAAGASPLRDCCCTCGALWGAAPCQTACHHPCHHHRHPQRRRRQPCCRCRVQLRPCLWQPHALCHVQTGGRRRRRRCCLWLARSALPLCPLALPAHATPLPQLLPLLLPLSDLARSCGHIPPRGWLPELAQRRRCARSPTKPKGLMRLVQQHCTAFAAYQLLPQIC